MDLFVISFFIAIASAALGVFMIIAVKPKLKEKKSKKCLLHMCNISFVIGMAIYISFLLCISFFGKHHDSIIIYEEYPIEKLTFDKVYFDSRDGKSFNESYVILENPDSIYQNVVVEEKEYFTLHWLFPIKTCSSKYHVYLSEDVFDRFQDGDVIYKSK